MKSIAFLLIIFFCSCAKSIQNEIVVFVRLPSLTYDMSLSKDLTYSAFTILSHTSAHLGRIDKDFQYKNGVFQSFKTDDYKNFLIKLNEKYRSSKNEKILASDLKYSILSYLQDYPSLSFVFGDIVNAKSCMKGNCDALGVEIIDDFALKVSLNSANKKFIEQLFNPWFVIFKEGKPRTISVGDCKIPYPTGKGRILSCSKKDSLIEVEVRGKRVRLSDKGDCDVNKYKCLKLVNDNPGKDILPSLTVMSVFANPDAKLSEKDRKYLLSNIRTKAKLYAEKTKQKHAPTMMSSWIGLKLDSMSDSAIASSKEISCPKNRKVKILLDTSLPDLDQIKKWISSFYKCSHIYKITTADKYFKNFSESDFGIAWFTPDELKAYNFYSSMDCNVGASCYFNWRDKKLLDYFSEFKRDGESSGDQELVSNIEKYLISKGYAAPISEMNWWIVDEKSKKSWPIHPAGLAEVKVSDFIDEN